MGQARYAGPVAFLAGAAVMVAEVGIVRLAAPVLGASQPVWATVVAAVLLGLALGNALGGAWAAGGPDARTKRLASLLLLAGGAGLGALPFVLAPALGLVAQKGAAGPVAALLLLGVAAALPVFPLGALTPLVVRAASERLEDVGPATGRLQALSTAGALAGTLGSTFLLTPALGSTRTFAATGAALVLAGAMLGGGRSRALALLGAAFFLPPSVPARPGETLLAHVESPYATWDVTRDERGVVRLLADDGSTVQSYLDPRGELQGGSWPLLAAAPLLAGKGPKDPSRVALVGLAGGTVAREIALAFPGARITAFEIDPAALALARAEFDLPRERLLVETRDGRLGLRDSGGGFDAIVLDAYRTAYVPPHLVSREFLELAKARLAPGGVVLMNLLSAKRWRPLGGSATCADEGPLVNACAATARSVFGRVYLLDARNGLNTILVATDRPLDPVELARAPASLEATRPSLARYLATSLPGLHEAPVTGDSVLTDDCSPVEWLSHRLAIERLAGKP